MPHLPASQTACPKAVSLLQLCAQAQQFARSVCMSMQTSPQRVSPLPH